MVCLAPRALEDSVRPRRLAGVIARPLNFTVSRAAFMAVVLVLVVVALALTAYLSATSGDFGLPLRLCLSIPAAAILICICAGFLLARVLPPRSSWVLVVLPVILPMTVVELIAFATAIVRLARTRDLRTRRNVLITAFGGLSLVPVVGTYLIVIVGDRYAG